MAYKLETFASSAQTVGINEDQQLYSWLLLSQNICFHPNYAMVQSSNTAQRTVSSKHTYNSSARIQYFPIYFSNKPA